MKLPYPGCLGAALLVVTLGLAAPALAQDSAVLVKDIVSGSGSSSIRLATAVGSQAFFAADDGVAGPELWKSDGTSAGTVLVKDIKAGANGSLLAGLTAFDGRLFFRADDGVSGGELWASNGTTAGTVMVKDIRPDAGSAVAELTPVGSSLFFRANDGTHGLELWKTNGTPAGTVLVKDITIGAEGSALEQFARAGSTLFFVADSNGDDIYELWKSNGTAGGTVPVTVAGMAMRPGNPGSVLTGVGDTLYFRADDPATGTELWRSDGTPAGTMMVKDIVPGTGSSAPTSLTAVGSTVFFVAEDGGGRNLWKSDGTPGGTVQVKVVRTGGGGSIEQLTAVGSTLFFVASDDRGRELWKSDGTTDGTVLVKDIAPGTAGSSPAELTNVNGTLHFRANDRLAGEELWKSDGTEGGTVLVADVNAGLAGSSPSDFVVVGALLLFDADNGLNGREFWRLGPSGPPVLVEAPPPITVGASNTLLGGDFSAGTVVKLFVGTGGGVLSFGPYAITGRTLSSITFEVPPDVPLGNGVVAIQVIKTDQGFLASNIVGTLLFGDPGDNIPTIRNINGQWLGPGDLSYAVAYAEAVVTAGSAVTIGGSGFRNPLVNVFTAAGNIGPLVPLSGGTSTEFQVVLPTSAPTGPGNFQVVNEPYAGNVGSQIVAAVINARPTITSITQVGSTVTVNGTGFSTVSVINLFNEQPGGLVNLGGFGPSGAPNVPLTVVNENQMTFTRPAAAVAGPAFIEVLNPPFIPFTTSGSDPDGAFSFTGGGAPFITTSLFPAAVAAPAADPAARAATAAAAAAPLAPSDAVERVTWASTESADVHGGGGRSPAARPWRVGARSTRVLVGGDGFVEWTVGRRGAVAVGLSHGDTDGSLADIDFALRVDAATGELAAVERGHVAGAFGTVVEGDVLRVSVRNGAIEYSRNGALLATSTAVPRYPLLVDSSLGSPRAVLEGVLLGGRLGTLVEWPARRGVTVTGTRATATRASVLRALAGEAASVDAALSNGAGTGFGRNGCDYCVVRTGEGLEVRHAGTVRGAFSADASARVRVELDGDVVRYWVGTTRLDEAPLAGPVPAQVIGLFERAGAVIDGAAIATPTVR